MATTDRPSAATLAVRVRTGLSAMRRGRITADFSARFPRPRHFGSVDRFDGTAAFGWCFVAERPEEPVEIEVRVDGAPAALVRTGLAREDVAAAAGKAALRCGFAFSAWSVAAADRDRLAAALDRALAPGRGATDWLSFHVAAGGAEILRGPGFRFGRADAEALRRALGRPQADVSVNPRPDACIARHRGAVDMIDGEAVTGWCFAAEAPDARTALEVRIGDVRVGLAETGLPRPDVAGAAGAPCRPGFRFAFSDCPTEALRPALRALDEAAAAGRAPGDAVRLRPVGAAADLRGPQDGGDAEALARLRGALAARLDQLANNSRHGALAAMLDDDAPARRAGPEDVRVVAFYLPQFHPTAENDAWWGEGFTEWTNVAAARPLFPGHDQPRIPADLGFYDLRAAEVQRRQVALARRYGVSAFCYYFYWFSGTRLLDLPVERHLREDLPLDYCLCWANENWSRRWDGSDRDVLMSQQHNPQDDASFIEAVLPHFRSGRYLKLDGAPLLLVYRMSLMSDPHRVAAAWRAAVRAAGFPDLHLCMVESFGLDDPAAFGADSSCQFPPHGAVVKAPLNAAIEALEPGFSGVIYDYAEVVANEARRPDARHLRFRGAMPAWDNTARRGKAGNVFHGADPALFEAWLSILCAKAQRDLPPGKRLVFVNAWNEWAEGAHLEPDRRHGRANLRAVRAALSQRNLLMAEALLDAAGAEGGRLEALSAMRNANERMLEMIAEHSGWSAAGPSPFIRRPLEALETVESHEDAAVQIDGMDGRAPGTPEPTVDRARPLQVVGWARFPRLFLSPDLPVFLMLGREGRPGGEGDFVAAVPDRPARPDVAAAFGDAAGQSYGFDVRLDLRAVEPGAYRLLVLAGSLTAPRAACAARSRFVLHVG